jgi:large subunit ribosomal protein L22
MEVKATSKYVRVPPSKARQVIQHIKGLDVEAARRVLEFSPKGVALQIRKTLDSAVANAEHNEDLDADDLVVTRVIVDEGPTLRRFQPRAMGRAYRIRKRTSHITVTVGLREPEPAVAAAAGRGRTRPAAAAPDDATTEGAPTEAGVAEAPEAEAGPPDAPQTAAEAPETDTTAEADTDDAPDGAASDDEAPEQGKEE